MNMMIQKRIQKLTQKKVLLLSGILFAALFLSACNEKEYIHVGPNWEKIHELKASEQTFNVHISGVKSSYALGEKLAFEVTSAKSGRLWIVQVDPNDQVTLMMPNQLQSDNQVTANKKFSFPPEGASWSAPASEPVGESVLAFIVTTGDTDLNNVLNGQLDNKAVMQKTFQIIKNEPAWGLTSKVVKINK